MAKLKPTGHPHNNGRSRQHQQPPHAHSQHQQHTQQHKTQNPCQPAEATPAGILPCSDNKFKILKQEMDSPTKKYDSTSSQWCVQKLCQQDSTCSQWRCVFQSNASKTTTPQSKAEILKEGCSERSPRDTWQPPRLQRTAVAWSKAL